MEKLRTDNPYFNGLILYFPDDSEPLLEAQEIKYVKSPRDKFHIVTEYDTLSSIAFERYGNSKLFHVIAKANNLLELFDLPVGSSIIIPDLADYKARTR